MSALACATSSLCQTNRAMYRFEAYSTTQTLYSKAIPKDMGSIHYTREWISLCLSRRDTPLWVDPPMRTRDTALMVETSVRTSELLYYIQYLTIGRIKKFPGGLGYWFTQHTSNVGNELDNRKKYAPTGRPINICGIYANRFSHAWPVVS